MKIYVDVIAEFSKEGRLIPKSIRWEDGNVYEIAVIPPVKIILKRI